MSKCVDREIGEGATSVALAHHNSTIILRKTSDHHNRTKHNGRLYHFIQDCVNNGRIVIKNVKIEDQLMD